MTSTTPALDGNIHNLDKDINTAAELATAMSDTGIGQRRILDELTDLGLTAWQMIAVENAQAAHGAAIEDLRRCQRRLESLRVDLIHVQTIARRATR